MVNAQGLLIKPQNQLSMYHPLLQQALRPKTSLHTFVQRVVHE